MGNNFFDIDDSKGLDWLAGKLRVEAAIFAQSIPSTDVYDSLFAALRTASTPSITAAYLERVYNLATAIAEFSVNTRVTMRPSRELTALARNYAICFNGFGNVSRPVPNFALT